MVNTRKRCAFPGCAVILVGPAGKYCAEHKGYADRGRPTAVARGYDARWRSRRATYLDSIAELVAGVRTVYCENCAKPHVEGRPGVFLAEDDGHPIEVDHIDGRGPKGDNRDANLQALCRSCHQRKTALQTRTGGRS